MSTSASSSREGAQCEKNCTSRKSVLSRSESERCAFFNDAPTKCATLFSLSKLWFAGTGATDAPECADPCPRTTAVPAPPTLLMDRPRPIPGRRKAADQSQTHGRVQHRV